MKDAIEEQNPKERLHVSPLFKRHEQEFISLHQENLFYGYRTTMKHKRGRGSLLTVKASRNTSPKRLYNETNQSQPSQNRPMTSRGVNKRKNGIRIKTRTIAVKRPKTALSQPRLPSHGKYLSTQNIKNTDVFLPNKRLRYDTTARDFSSTNQLRRIKNNETTSSFFRDDFSFNNRTSRSSLSHDRKPKARKFKAVQLTRQTTSVIGKTRKIHHGTLDMTLNELKNIFKLRYEHKDEPPINDVIFELGIDENCPQINCNIIDCNRQVGRLVIK